MDIKMTGQITVAAYAKINLTLDILGRRRDGFHDLRMVMQAVSLHDSVSIALNYSGEITLDWSLSVHHGGESNTAVKAARAFLRTLENDKNKDNRLIVQPLK